MKVPIRPRPTEAARAAARLDRLKKDKKGKGKAPVEESEDDEDDEDMEDDDEDEEIEEFVLCTLDPVSVSCIIYYHTRRTANNPRSTSSSP